jgi:hypothetical protein
MSLLRRILAIKPVRLPLEFGINENIRLTAISNEVRKRDGEVIPRNTFLTFSKYNEKGQKIAATEFSYFNLDHTSQFVLENLVTQLAQLTELASLLNPDAAIDPISSFETEEEIVEALRTSKGCKAIMKDMYDQFEESVKDFINDESPLLRVKIVTDNKGKYLQLPREGHFVENVETPCTLSINAYELKTRQKGAEPQTETPDRPAGTDEATKPKKKSALAGL